MKNKPTGNTLHDDAPPIAVQFPLRGEWIAVNTPGYKIPSHGTDQLGQRFAYDFITPRDLALAKKVWTDLRYWFGGGIPLEKTSSWQKPILAPVSGKVIAAKEGWPEPRKASPADLFRLFTLAFRVNEQQFREDFRHAAGNYLIIESKDCFAFLAHATTGSIRVREGELVTAGQHIADVGHTGSSSQPHLHFHLMDGPDLWTANGLPCCFERYEELRDDVWRAVENGIPGNKAPVRPIGTA